MRTGLRMNVPAVQSGHNQQRQRSAQSASFCVSKTMHDDISLPQKKKCLSTHRQCAKCKLKHFLRRASLTEVRSLQRLTVNKARCVMPVQMASYSQLEAKPPHAAMAFYANDDGECFRLGR